MLCNEPSLGLFYVQDNIRNSVPRLCFSVKRKLKTDRDVIENCQYGCEYSLGLVRALTGLTTLASVIERTKIASTTAEIISYV
jgi:hypothetical protein